MKKLSIILLLASLGNGSIAQNFKLNSCVFKVGDVYLTKPDILFDLAKWSIIPESHPQLDSIADFLLENDNLIIEVGVHTDSRGSDAYSMRLDQKRAESIVTYLKEKGVRPDRLIAKGYGKTQLIISDDEINKMKTVQEKEEAHATNRRTEFKIIGVNR